MRVIGFSVLTLFACVEEEPKIEDLSLYCRGILRQ